MAAVFTEGFLRRQNPTKRVLCPITSENCASVRASFQGTNPSTRGISEVGFSNPESISNSRFGRRRWVLEIPPAPFLNLERDAVGRARFLILSPNEFL